MSITPLRAALLTFGLAVATIAGAWAFQLMGYQPCDLCFKERIAYYIGVPLALAVVGLAASNRAPGLARIGFSTLAILFLASAMFGAYHAGIEWKFWKGPADCTNLSAGPLDGQDLLGRLNHIVIVPCDAAAFRILGISLAGWNAVVSLLIALTALTGLRRTGTRRP